MERTFAEAYTMRSRHYQLLGEAGKMMASAWLEADAENRQAMKDNAFEAMVHSLMEHHLYAREEITG